jgi:DNA ligase 1
MQDTDTNDLAELWALVVALRGVSSTKLKVNLIADRIKDNVRLRSLLRNVYHPYIQYNLTSGAVEKSKVATVAHDMEMGPMLRRLFTRRVTGHLAIAQWKGLLERLEQPELQEAANLCLDKDLKCRVGVALLNAAFEIHEVPLVPVFSVALGEPLKQSVLDFENEEWLASRKLDGVRCIAILLGESCQLLSRKGIPITNFQQIEKSLLRVFEPYTSEGVVIDGELSILNDDGVDDFQGVMKVLRTKYKTGSAHERVRFNAFDFLTLEAFEAGKTSRILSKRLADLKSQMDAMPSNWVKCISQIPVKSQDHFDGLIRSAMNRGWEGIIVRKNAPYQGKRSTDIRKVKKKGDGEFIVKSIVKGKMGIVEAGKEIQVPAMAAVVIEYKDNEVKVGSGWSVEERRAFIADPSLIIGKVITVEFMEESVDSKTKTVSLRHPVVKVIHGNDRTL